jgi:6-phosphogluconolactonase
MSGRIEISSNPDRQADFVADWLIALMNARIGDFRLVLAGGSTPRRLYTVLGGSKGRHVPWDRLQLYWGDERFVPHTDPASNYGMAFDAMLRGAPIPPERLHPIPVSGTIEEAALGYESLLRGVHAAAEKSEEARPFFDVILLGLGTDGHTCSLFPGAPTLDETVHWVAVADGGRPEPRITLTYPALAMSRHVAFLVAGEEKQPAVLRAIAGDEQLPAARVRSQGEIVWFLDLEAAGPLYRR